MIREVEGIMARVPGMSFTQALKLQQASSDKKPTDMERGMLALMAPPYNLSAADAFLIANNKNIVGDILEDGPEAVRNALAELKGLGQPSGNTGGNNTDTNTGTGTNNPPDPLNMDGGGRNTSRS